MGRFVDAIRCHILEKYMSSYMRERNMDALLVLRNENKWAMTGKYFNIFYYVHGINIIMSYNVIMSCNVVNVMIVYIEYRTFFITVGPPGTTRVPDP
jgi:hypothetical protein